MRKKNIGKNAFSENYEKFLDSEFFQKFRKISRKSEKIPQTLSQSSINFKSYFGKKYL